MLFREHLCARFWRRLGLQSCWGSGVSQPCVIVLHRAFPWYWPVHPDIYGFALYAVYPSRHLWLCLVCRVYVCLVYVCIALLLVLCLVTSSMALLLYYYIYIYCLVLVFIVVFSGSEDAISRASLRTLLARPWASILLGIRCFATMPHRAPQGFSMVLAGPSRHLWLCLLCLALPSV